MTKEPMPRCEFDSRSLILEINMKIPADVNAIGPLIERVMGIVKEMGCVKGKEFEVKLSLQEALANAIVHGCRKDPGKIVEICVSCDESRGMLIVIRDPGPGFDPASLPSPIIGQKIFSSHGRGIYLINRLMDEVHIERGGTEIHMVKR